MRYPSYPKYKPSEVDWLGNVPEHWDSVLLKRILIAISDGTHGTYERVSNGQPLLSAKNVFNNGIQISDNESQVSNEDFIEITKKGFPRKGDLLVTCVGTIGRSCVYDFDYPLAFQRSICFLRLKTGTLPQFYKYVIESKGFQEYLISIANVSAQGGVYMGDLSQSSIPKVPLVEQQTIANFLDHETGKIDHLIGKKRQFIETLKEKRTALISHAVTKGLNPDAKLKPSGIDWMGDVPEHWEVKRLKYSTSINDETLPESLPSDYELLYVDIGSVDPVQGIHKKEPMLFEDAPSRARRIVREGDSIISTVRTYLKAISPIRNAEKNLIVSTGFAVVRPRKINANYLSYVLRTPYFIETVVSYSVGVSYPAINSSQLGIIEIPIPDSSAQQAIADYLDAETDKIDRLIDKVGNAIHSLQEYRSAIISEAVTGKIDVRKGVS